MEIETSNYTNLYNVKSLSRTDSEMTKNKKLIDIYNLHFQYKTIYC